jgi:hypothetical protein
MSTPTPYGARSLKSLGSSPGLQLTATSVPPRGLVTRLFDAFVRWQLGRLDQRIATLKLDERYF